MRVIYKIILCFLLIVTACFQSFAQYGQFQFKHIDIYDGLSHNQVNCILKDDRGFMWFGTLSGLDRYDGYSFHVFRHDIRDSASLNDNYITGIYKLPAGKLWINTRIGGNIYNPETETFNRNYNQYLKTLSLPTGLIHQVVEDKNNDYWFVYASDGLYRYSPDDGKVMAVQYKPNNPTSLSDNNVSDMAFDPSGNLWIVHGNGIIEKLDKKSLEVNYRNDSLLIMNKGKEKSYKLFIDREGDLWVYAYGSDDGLFYFDKKTKIFHHLTTNSTLYPLNNNIIYDVIQDRNGVIWVGTDHGGINLINKKNASVRYLLHNPEDNRSLAQNSIYTLYSDNSGIIWIGTYKKGVCYYNELFNRFPLYSHIPQDKHSLPYEDVNGFVEDKKGNLWIGTNGGGLIYFNRKNNTYKQYLHDPDNPGSLCNNVIVGLCMDSEGKLWIGTYTGGLDCFDGKTFKHYKHDPNDSTSLSNNNVWDIFEDSENRLWIATLGGGLQRFDRRHRHFISYKSKSKAAGINFVLVVTEVDNKLWMGTAAGVEVLNLRTNDIKYYRHDPNDSTSLSNDNLNTIFRDSRGRVWVGTREGLNLFNPETQDFTTFTVKDGLASNTILKILEDEEHRLWISTPNGLSCLTIAKKGRGYDFSFKNYNETDGLQGREFNEKSAYKTREGLLIFGGPNGFNMFNPALIKPNKKIPPVVFTDFQVYNKSVPIGKEVFKHVILPGAISGLKKISIPYKANDFSIAFAALGYAHTAKNKYAYKLAGFNNDWIISGNETHKVTYTNLDPGSYTFLVKSSNNDGIWGQKPASLQIEVLPPFWDTTLAYIIYVLLLLGVLYLARSILLYRARMNFRIEHQKQEAQHIHELDVMKLRFFTNVSHELRTPLTLILKPLESILKQTKDEKYKSQLQLINRNAKRLFHLVNQLLDFRRMEVQEIQLHLQKADIVRFIKEEVLSFTDIAEKKKIYFSLETTLESLETEFDPNKLERILFNLLSNAFKFTHERGNIKIQLCLQTEQDKDNTNLVICVKDDGIGIPPDKQEHIFERFFQLDIPSAVVNPGSGIGLAITHEFVRLHHGTIKVKSEPGKGSCFTVRLPVIKSGNILETAQNKIISINQEEEITAKERKKTKQANVLIIDDNEDFRFYLKDNLSVYFNMEESSDGKQGWEKILKLKPDLVVCDIMMPEMNGIALAKRLKKDPRTTDIPVILLTARSSEEQKMEGYDTGANDYITKPFNFEILLARIKNLLAEKKQQDNRKPPKTPISPSEIELTSEDEKFLREVSSVVEEKMGDPDFSVKALSAALYISRVTLYKKLSAITGKTPVVFIRLMRIKRAAQLIKNGEMNIAQAAYEVGFNNPKYFTKYFKEEFGVLPSEYGRKE